MGTGGQTSPTTFRGVTLHRKVNNGFLLIVALVTYMHGSVQAALALHDMIPLLCVYVSSAKHSEGNR